MINRLNIDPTSDRYLGLEYHKPDQTMYYGGVTVQITDARDTKCWYHRSKQIGLPAAGM